MKKLKKISTQTNHAQDFILKMCIIDLQRCVFVDRIIDKTILS